MSRSKYEYTTSPRKTQTDYQKKKQKNKIRVLEDLPRQDINVTKNQRKKQRNLTLIVIAIFVLLLTISYRNSQINEQFSKIQSLKRELSSLEKENEQLKVSIENGINPNNIERQAKEQLGMQKLTNKQTKYVKLPKKDYVEVASEKVVIEEEKSFFDQICEWLGINN